MPEAELVVGLDIGGSVVRALVAEATGASQIKVLTCGMAPSAGIRRGVVTDLDDASRAIAAAVADAENRAKATLGKVILSVAGEHLASLNTRGVGAVAATDQEVRTSDIKHIVKQAQQIVLPPEREILQVLVRQFHLDGQDGIKNPVGMSGLRLEVETHIVTGLTSHLKNLARAVEGAGLTIVEPVLAPLASASATLTEQERELGVICLDIGASMTGWTVFEAGEVLASGFVSLGGERVTLDLALGLGMTRDAAEQLKCTYNAMERDPAVEEVSLARMAEIFELVAAGRARAGVNGLLPGGCVITGGGARLFGAAEVAQEILGGPARVAGPSEANGDPSLSCAIGLALWGAHPASRSSQQGWRALLDTILRKRSSKR